MSVAIEDIYPLAPAQQGLLFDHLSSPEAPIYVEQLLIRMQGELDVERFQSAWHRAVQTHAALRTVFVWKGLNDAVQVVLRQMDVPLLYQDWRDLSEVEQAQRLHSHCECQRTAFTDLSKAPLIRLSLYRMQDSTYEFVCTQPHVLLDGWSMALVLQDVFSAYEQPGGGEVRRSTIASVRDYLVWLRGQDQSQARQFWKESLRGCRVTSVAAHRKQRNGRRTVSAADVRRDLGATLTAGLGRLCKERRLTLSTVFQTAWALVLSSYTGQNDVIFGTSVSTRPEHLTGSDTLVGFFLNTLPVRASITPSARIAALLQDLQVFGVEAGRHGHWSLSTIMAAAGVARGTPLFDTAFVLENYPMELFHNGGSASLRIESIRFVERTEYALALQAVPVRGEVVLKLAYDCGLFERDTVERLLGHFERLLECIVENPDNSISDLPLLDEEHPFAGKRRGSESLPAREYPSILELFQQQVAHSPEADAVLWDVGQLSYRELDQLSSHLAQRLIRSGVRPETSIGISVDRGPEIVVGVLGIWKAGAAYVPIDPEHPFERQSWIADDAGVSFIVTRACYAPAMERLGRRVIIVEHGWSGSDGGVSPCPHVLPLPDQLAYIMYTSGSTGRPKGVLIPHKGLWEHAPGLRDLIGLGAGDRFLLVNPLTFDASVAVIFPTLISGAALFLPGPATDWSGRGVVKLIETQRITAIDLPATLWARAVEDLVREDLRVPATLKALVVGGEAPSPEALRNWCERLSSTLRFVNAYGPTETSVTATAWTMECDATPADLPSPVPIGRPIAGKRVYVLDSSLRPSPVGVAGELYIGGSGLARGYVHAPDLTAEKFVPDLFSSEGGSRLYRTGDIGRYLGDGQIEFVGRSDDQIKVNGIRIEAGEIETNLREHTAIREAVVVPHKTAPGAAQLVAHVVVERGQAPPSPGELRQWLQRKLPAWMVPGSFVFADTLPLNSHGKVDRSALPSPELFKAKDSAPARSELERTLAEIWGRVLGREQVGIHDNFFELGGDSILSIRIVSRASQVGIRLTPRQVFAYPTVAELAAVAETETIGQAEQGPVTGLVPLTPIQRWFFEQRLAAPNHYNQSVLIELRRRVEPRVLSSAFELLLKHHDALRLRFRQQDDRWMQWIPLTDEDAPFVYVDAARWPQSHRKQCLDDEAARLQASLDLTEGPLLRAALFDYAGSEPDRLLIAIHHLAVDGVSWGVLLEDLESACEQFEQGGSAQLPPKTTSFRSWAEQLTRYADAENLRAEVPYWTAARGVSVWGETRSDTAGGARHLHLRLDERQTEALLNTAAAQSRANVQELLLAALTKAFRETTGHRRFSVDLEGHGREDLFAEIDVSRTVGWFTSIFPLVLAGPEHADLHQTLREVKQTLRGIPGHGIGYGVLRYLSAALLPECPASDISFSYLGMIDTELTAASALFGTTSFAPSQAPVNRRSYPVEINAFVAGRRLETAWTYAESLESQIIESLAARCLENLRDLSASAGEPARAHIPSDFPLANIGTHELDVLRQRYPSMADVYPLAPSQLGLLFHGLYEPGSEVYFSQLALSLEGALDPECLRSTFDRVIARHPILRTAFAWQGLSAPVQVVQDQVNLPWIELDWRTQAETAAELNLGKLLLQDRQRPFDLATAPLMRVTLVRTSDAKYHLIWSHHHILLDGWCLPALWREVFLLYFGGEEQQFGPVRPYRDYIAWLQRQSLGEDEAYWRATLAGFERITPLPFDRRGSGASDQAALVETLEITVSSGVAARLQETAQRHSLTLNTVVQGMWAMLLSHFAGTEDIVFGCTTAGRPPHLPGVESIMGLFLNTLPLRVRVNRGQPCETWLRGLQTQLSEVLEHERLALPQIRRLSSLSARSPLFESVVVFENFAALEPYPETAGGLRMTGMRSFARNNFPLTLRVVPGSEITLCVLFDVGRFRTADAACIARNMAALLARFAACPKSSMDEYHAEIRQSEAEVAHAASAPAAGSAGESRSGIGRFSRGTRRKVVVSSESLVNVTSPGGARVLPVVVTPAVEGLSLREWAGKNKSFVNERLRSSGGMLFRGFAVRSPEEFEQFIHSLAGDLAEYRFASTPRTRVSGRVYTSTEYPSDQHIPLHNEMSFAASWPLKIWFWCSEPAVEGGETPIADGRRVLQRIEPSIVERFRSSGVMYVRNYGEGLDIPWQQVFQTSDRSEVDARCKEAGIEAEWRGQARLRTREVRSAVVAHPDTGEEVWFNQAHLFHVSALPANVRAPLLANFAEEDELPRNAFYGDGSHIEDSTMDEIRGAYDLESVIFLWQQGDVLMLDNVLAAHGRRPFRGPRRVLVGMAEPSEHRKP